MRPDGHHGLGTQVLTGLLRQLGMDAADTYPGVRVVCEERRADTIADLVFYGSGGTVVVEAGLGALLVMGLGAADRFASP